MTVQVSPASGTTTYSYDEHGESIAETDARGITVTRAVDALDRVTAVTYPDPSLDVLYTYDGPAVPFSKGRLTRIARPDSTIDYRYDRFGRLLQDGDLSFTWDANGNAESIVYPGDVTAFYTYDFADRPASLLARRPGKLDQPLAASAGYLPSCPLSSLTLGNGLNEIRGFDDRYFPSSISLTGNQSAPRLDVLDGCGRQHPLDHRHADSRGQPDVRLLVDAGSFPFQDGFETDHILLRLPAGKRT